MNRRSSSARSGGDDAEGRRGKANANRAGTPVDVAGYQALKTRQRAERETYHPNLGLRVHRALSWLNRAEQSGEDLDGRFIFLWIAFNAAYATEIDERYWLSEQATFRDFLRKLIDLDSSRTHRRSGVD